MAHDGKLHARVGIDESLHVYGLTRRESPSMLMLLSDFMLLDPRGSQLYQHLCCINLHRDSTMAFEHVARL